ncbi:hypothetical protein COT68_02625 [bacterium (Candidatus Torokbacteria) CG09_land_8_20_14_0_10_42_11]|nr:MAG: hypothetical protein COT68_02625 [bacterium (Candidatus Torokbacteria) CG09_land_8_20_14_0_10_42_11]
MNENKLKIIQDGLAWIMRNQAELPPSQIYCETRDVFKARLDRLIPELQKAKQSDSKSFLLSAVAGEIGNNSFDHNLGHWRDLAGVYFSFDLTRHCIVLADRGQGILSTIKKVRPEISNASEALRIAFTEKISGRAPEQRGNGLKFVRRVIAEQGWELYFYSGNASFVIKEKKEFFQEEKDNILGVLAIIKF